MNASSKWLRRSIHAHPDLSGHEANTADRLRRHFRELGFDNAIENLGGTGLAVVIDGREPGETVMLRAELDALPILEANDFEHRSNTPGVSHKCGHDGHMAILAEVGHRLAAESLQKGRVVLLFQPAEETGQGALDVLNDARFETISPDRVYALHNLPDFPTGQVVTRSGTFSCASRGMHIRLHGLQTHAAQPEMGKSPGRALREIMLALEQLGEGTAAKGEIAFATVVHVSMGSKSFGIAPGDAEIMATLRSERDATMAAMIERTEACLREVCQREKLRYSSEFADVFPATVNSSEEFENICAAASADTLQLANKPFRWSEDFGHFTARFPGAMFGLGAGYDTPPLHHPAYDFPDALITLGADIFMRLVGATQASRLARPAKPTQLKKHRRP